MTVDRTTPDDELKLLYLDNCSWYERQDPDMAARFVSVCEAILFRGITQVDINGAQVGLRPEVVRAEMASAKQFANQRATAQSVRFSDFQGFR